MSAQAMDGFNWIESNRTRGFETWEEEIAYMADMGYSLAPAEYKLPHWSETIRANERVAKLYVCTSFGPREMDTAFDRYSAEIGYPLFFKQDKGGAL